MNVELHDAPSRAKTDLEIAKKSPLWSSAVLYLREDSDTSLKQHALELYADDPEGWMLPYHFTTGMWIRNQLRDSGFGEQEFNIANLDNIYIELVEEAFGCKHM